MILEVLQPRFSVCKISDYSGIDPMQPFCFTGATDEENSLVCPEAFVPENTTEREDGWRGFRISGQLDFSLIGILARVSEILASNGIGIFVISTYNTDYIFTKEENFQRALKALKNNEFTIIS
ncbi:MAG: ACT domain-containing protein [Lachnospiraceae bacterium]|nr:ACT domain-containing protein [Lachnospiraceae bacterium]